MDIKELNEFYYQLQIRCNSLMLGLRHRILETECGWYNGHYYKMKKVSMSARIIPYR